MKTRSHTVLLAALLLLIGTANAVTRISKASGNWTNSGTWNPAGVPAAGDSIIVQATHTISITSQLDYATAPLPLKILVYGEIMFYNGSKLSLPCGSYIIIYAGGIIDHDQGYASSNLINICGIVEWNSNSTLYGLACLPSSHPVCAALPIELTSFTAQIYAAHTIILNWQTATENFNDHFEIERSADGENFTRIGAVASKAPGGNSLSKLEYSFSDALALDQANYYRLKQVDKDGAFTYTKIISLFNKGDGRPQILIVPNYNNGIFTAHLTGLTGNGSLVLTLRNAYNQVVYSSLYAIVDENMQVKVEPETKLAPGSYYCSFEANGQLHVVKVQVVTQ